ncbi:hypothetical protein SSX86_031517, partial [Deinandra increscens subsp. villosa]
MDDSFLSVHGPSFVLTVRGELSMAALKLLVPFHSQRMIGELVEKHECTSEAGGAARTAGVQIKELSTSSSPNFQKNLSLFSPDQVELANKLLGIGQGHLFEDWPDPGVEDDQKISFINQ